MEKAILIDGNSLMFRSYYGTIKQVDFFVKNNLFPTNAIKTMMLMIFRLLSENDYQYGLIAFDSKEKNFRKQEFDDYKKQRKATPENLVVQIEPIKQIMAYFGINVYCISGIEADDVVGSGAVLLSQNNILCDVYSSDYDLLQLVDNNVKVFQIKKGIKEMVCYDNNNFKDLFYGLSPSQIPDFKGISGDNSDNLPGIKGIGESSAIKLLLKYASLENIFDNIDFISSQSLKTNLIENKEIGLKCKKLATILTDYFNGAQIEKFSLKPINYAKIKEVINQYRFNGFKKYIKD